MGTFVAVANKILVGPLDLTGQANHIDFGPLTRATKTSTTMADNGWACVLPGLITGSAGVKGNQDWASTGLDATISTDQLGSQYPISAIPCPTGTVTAGNAAYMSRGLASSLDPMGGAKGEVGSFDLGMAIDTTIAQAKVAAYSSTQTATGNGTAVALGGPSASQSLYVALHVTAYSGLTNVIFKVQSDDNSGFSSATDRITLTTVTSTTSQWSSAVGAFASETHHRIVWTATGAGSITFTALVGVI